MSAYSCMLPLSENNHTVLFNLPCWKWLTSAGFLPWNWKQAEKTERPMQINNSVGPRDHTAAEFFHSSLFVAVYESRDHWCTSQATDSLCSFPLNVLCREEGCQTEHMRCCGKCETNLHQECFLTHYSSLTFIIETIWLLKLSLQ